MADLYSDIYSDIYATSGGSVTVAGSGALSVPLVSSQPPPAAQSLNVPVANVAGDWMLALVSWRQTNAGEGITCTVGDDVHNFWDPVGAPSANSSASGVTCCSIWVAPAAKAAGYVTVAPSGPYQAIAVTVLDVSAMASIWYTPTGLVSGFTNAGTTVNLNLAAPASSSLQVSVSAAKSITAAITYSDTSASALPQVTTSNGTNTAADLQQNSAWRTTSASTTAHWSSSTPTALAGVTVSIALTGTAGVQPNLSWPYMVTEVALGAGATSHADALTWTTIQARSMDFEGTQGRQYQLAALQTGAGSMTLDNPDGALIPPGSGGLAGIDSGTPVRVRTVWQGGGWQVQFHGDGTTATPQIDSGAVIPATAGQAYSVAAWLACSTPWPSGVTLKLVFRNSGGTTLATFTSAAVTGLVATRATAAGTAPANTAHAAVIISAAGTPPSTTAFLAAAAPVGAASQGYLAVPPAVSWIPENAATSTTLSVFAPDVRGPVNVTPWAVAFSGFFQKWPQQWTEGTQRGVTVAQLVDAWNYCNGNLQPILFVEILNDLPYAYWPLIDAVGSTQASNRATGNSNPLLAAQSKYGTGGTTYQFGANSSALLGAQGTLLLTSSVRQQAQSGMWSLVQVSGVTTTPNCGQGYTLTCSDANFPALSGGVTAECWFQSIPPFPALNETVAGVVTVTNPAVMMLLTATGDAFFIVQIGVNSTTLNNDLQVALPQPGLPTTTFNVGNGATYANMTDPQHLAVTLTTSAWTVYLNGVQTGSGSWPGPVPPQFTSVYLNGDAGQFASAIGLGSPPLFDVWQNYTGYTGHVAVFGKVLSQDRINTHYLAGATAMAGDTVQYRIERLLQGGGYLGRRVILPDTAVAETTVVSCQDIAGQPAATSISNVTLSNVPATWTVTPQGELFYLSRSRAFNQPVVWVLGDNPLAGEIPYEGGDFTVDYDPARIYNDVQLTQLDNQDVVLPDLSQAASQAQYGDITYWETGYLEGDLTSPLTFGPSLVDLANWVADTNGRPFLRPGTVTVDAANNPANWTFITQAACGDVVVVNRRPPTSGLVLSFTGRISQTSRALTGGEQTTGRITATIDPCPEEDGLTLNDPVRGLLNGTNVLGW